MEACGTALHWGRVAQSHGHRVTLLPVRYGKPYLRGNKTDRTDVDALLDAVRTGYIPPVTVKTVAQQEIVALPAEAVNRIATLGGATGGPQGPHQGDHRHRQQTRADRLGRVGA